MRVLVTGGSGFIGTNLVAFLLARGHAVTNLDSQTPLMDAHRAMWQTVDIRDTAGIAGAIARFQPDHIVHLAALATFEASKAELDSINIGGTINVLEGALANAPHARILVTSTQYVNGPGTPFDNDLAFHPVNDYGHSKAGAEMAARSERYAALDWIITRPTNIWGAFHPRFPTEIWKYIRQGFYMHPGHDPIERAYGYVGNVCLQTEILLQAPAERVRHRVFYLTDPPLDSYDVLNAFSFALRERPLRRVSYPLLRMLALAGDSVRLVGLKAPFRSDRLHRMTSPHSARFESLWAELGCKSVGLPDAVKETLAWLKQHYPGIYA